MPKGAVLDRIRTEKPVEVKPPSATEAATRFEALNAIVADAQRKPHKYVADFKVEGGGE